MRNNVFDWILTVVSISFLTSLLVTAITVTIYGGMCDRLNGQIELLRTISKTEHDILTAKLELIKQIQK